LRGSSIDPLIGELGGPQALSARKLDANVKLEGDYIKQHGALGCVLGAVKLSRRWLGVLVSVATK
jgi:hypothetical protein